MAVRRKPRRRDSTLPINATPEQRIERLERRNRKLTALLDVAKALTAEHNIDNLLDIILQEAIRIVDAERGSLFLISRDRTELWSKIAHGLQLAVIRLPVGEGIAGYVAATGEILDIPDAYADPRFDPKIDHKTGFTTRTILCVPMLAPNGSVVGVIQALNHAHGPFTEDDEDLLLALGANAAVAIENANLYEDIEKLLEGFVEASVTAIECRDPSTSGHSNRVSALSLELLRAVPRSEGKYRHLRFGEREMREMRYAALLHDFGKVGVRENVLLKPSKLYPHELEVLEARFEQARSAHQVRFLQMKVDALQTHTNDRQELAAALEEEWKSMDGELNTMLDFIRRVNRPTVLKDGGGIKQLADLAQMTFVDLGGRERHLLSEEEHTNLKILKGSLNKEERREIESHVQHTFNFLMRIPWTEDLARVPEFAHGHHEKLDGSGYPLGISGDRIPVQTRIMTIADIYDALTATDRPYKSAMSHERALSILQSEVDRNKIDGDLLEVFVDAKVAQRALAKFKT
jgi:HD-GYP domain-containing protein (c-di-GMP phosphodiesterase class II)